eukprot:13278337-Alexandrium_andersonii.AAC.1
MGLEGTGACWRRRRRCCAACASQDCGLAEESPSPNATWQPCRTQQHAGENEQQQNPHATSGTKCQQPRSPNPGRPWWTGGRRSTRM